MSREHVSLVCRYHVHSAVGDGPSVFVWTFRMICLEMEGLSLLAQEVRQPGGNTEVRHYRPSGLQVWTMLWLYSRSRDTANVLRSLWEAACSWESHNNLCTRLTGASLWVIAKEIMHFMSEIISSINSMATWCTCISGEGPIWSYHSSWNQGIEPGCKILHDEKFARGLCESWKQLPYLIPYIMILTIS